jgi:uncharacterized protein YoxC
VPEQSNDSNNMEQILDVISKIANDVTFLMRSLDDTNKAVMALSDSLKTMGNEKNVDMDKIADYVIGKIDLNEYAKKRNRS